MTGQLISYWLYIVFYISDDIIVPSQQIFVETDNKISNIISGTQFHTQSKTLDIYLFKNIVHPKISY